MSTPSAAMIKAGVDWLKAYDADAAVDYGYEELVTLIWSAMEAARADRWQGMADALKDYRSQSWNDAAARERLRTAKRRVTKS